MDGQDWPFISPRLPHGLQADSHGVARRRMAIVLSEGISSLNKLPPGRIMLSTRSIVPPTQNRNSVDFSSHLSESDLVSFLIQKARSLGLEVRLKDKPTTSVEIDAESEHCVRCLEVASRLICERDSATDYELVEWFRGRRKAARTALLILSLRERQVVMLVAHGYSNKRVAVVLTVSEKTVEKYRGSACRKLHVHTSAELALLIAAADVFVSPSGPDDLGPLSSTTVDRSLLEN